MKIYLAGIDRLAPDKKSVIFVEQKVKILLTYFSTIDNLFDHAKSTLWCLNYNKSL